MDHMVTGIFKNSEDAGTAVAALNRKGYTRDISVMARDDSSGQITSHQVKETMSASAATGAASGGALGGLLGASATVVNFAGIGSFLVAGPLVTVLGAALGVVTGGFLGALVNRGLSTQKAAIYQERLGVGEVLVAVTVSHDREDEVIDVLKEFKAQEITSFHG